MANQIQPNNPSKSNKQPRCQYQWHLNKPLVFFSPLAIQSPRPRMGAWNLNDLCVSVRWLECPQSSAEDIFPGCLGPTFRYFKNNKTNQSNDRVRVLECQFSFWRPHFHCWRWKASWIIQWACRPWAHKWQADLPRKQQRLWWNIWVSIYLSFLVYYKYQIWFVYVQTTLYCIQWNHVLTYECICKLYIVKTICNMFTRYMMEELNKKIYCIPHNVWNLFLLYFAVRTLQNKVQTPMKTAGSFGF